METVGSPRRCRGLPPSRALPAALFGFAVELEAEVRIRSGRLDDHAAAIGNLRVGAERVVQLQVVRRGLRPDVAAAQIRIIRLRQGRRGEGRGESARDDELLHDTSPWW